MFNHKKTIKDFNANKFKITIYRKVGDRYVELESKKIKMEDKNFRMFEKDFILDTKKIAFSDKRSNCYAFDYDTGTPLTFDKLDKNALGNEEIDVYVNRGIIRQLVKALEKTNTDKGQWIFYIVCLGLGVAVGFIIGQQLTAANIANTPVPTPIPTPIYLP